MYQPPFSPLNPRPKLPKEKPKNINVYEWIERQASQFKQAALGLRSPEAVQVILKKVDIILANIARLQHVLGGIRKSIAQHASFLRKNQPVKRTVPSEGTVRHLETGNIIIYVDGAWGPYIPGTKERVIIESGEDVFSVEEKFLDGMDEVSLIDEIRLANEIDLAGDVLKFDAQYLE